MVNDEWMKKAFDERNQITEELECNCDFGTISEEDKEFIEKNLSKGKNLEQELELFRKSYNTKSKHELACPVNISKYEPGEFLCNTVRSWANSTLLPQSKGMLTTGPVNKKDPEYERLFKGQAGICGVYRRE